MAQPVVLFSTCKSQEKAQDIARHLVELHLAACVNVIPGVKSTFRWEGKINVEDEFLLIIKSQRDQIGSIQEVIQEISGYELPELIAADVIDGSAAYIDWIIAETRLPPHESTSE